MDNASRNDINMRDDNNKNKAPINLMIEKSKTTGTYKRQHSGKKTLNNKKKTTVKVKGEYI